MKTNHEAYRMLTVYVLAPQSSLNLTIDAKSGIVGSLVAHDPSRMRVDYEGNRYQASSLVTFADRVAQAAGRHVTNYPTVARAWVPNTDLIPIGRWDEKDGVVIVDNAGELARWLGIDAVPDRELRATGARYEQRRAFLEAVRSPNPVVRRFAVQEARRLNIDL